MQQSLLQIESDFNNIINSKPNNLKTKEELVFEKISLINLQKQIKKMVEIRQAVLRQFHQDINFLINNQGITFSWDKYHLIKENCFDLMIKNEDRKVECLLKPNDVLQVRDFKSEKEIELDQNLATILFKIMPCINGLFAIIQDERTSNILANSFYDSYFIEIDNPLECLEISGLGITLPFEKVLQTDLTAKERIALSEYYKENFKKILSKILIANGEELSPYQTKETKGKVLRMYKKGKR